MSTPTISYEILQSTLSNQWSDDYPVALFPVKVQIRFMHCLHLAKVENINLVANAQSITSLTAETKSALQDLSTRLKKAGPSPDAVLLPAHQLPAGGDRSFPTNGFAPVPDQKELWLRFYPDDIHLHTHEEPLTNDEYQSGLDFWLEMNQAASIGEEEERKVAQVAAWRVLASGYGNARGAWIAKETRPANFSETTALDPETLNFPTQNGDDNTTTWNVAPKTTVLPKYFVVKTYREVEQLVGGERKKVMLTEEYVGQPIAEEVTLSINPDADKDAFQETNTGLDLPPEIKWLVDFDEAEAMGMAIRISLSDEEANKGFDKIIVLGVKTDQDHNASKELLEGLITNHHYKPGGLSIVPQGTPTNNTEESDSGMGLEDLSPTESFDLEFAKNAFIPTNDHQQKCDGQRLAEALGVDFEYFQNIYYNTGKDIAQNIKINQVLWHASLGYSLPQYLYPLIRQAEVDNTCRFMVNYALCRGFLPTIRVDDQPYGVLVTTDFKQFQLIGNDPFDTFIGQLNDNVLFKLDQVWQEFSSQITHLGKDTPATDFAEIFYKILELHAGSVTYDQQLIVGKNIVSAIEEASGNNIIANTDQVNLIQQGFNNLLGVDLNSSPLALSYIQSDIKAPLIEKSPFNQGQIIDGLPKSSTTTIEAISDSNQNYINWLASFDTHYDHIIQEDFSNLTSANITTPPRSLFYNLLRYSLIRHYMITAMRIKYRDTPSLAEAFIVDFEENLVWVETDDSDAEQITNAALNEQFRIVMVDFLKKDRITEFKVEALSLFPNPDQQEQRDNFVGEQIANTDLDAFASQRLEAIINVEANRDDLLQNNKLQVLEYEIDDEGENKKIKDYIDEKLELENHEETAQLRLHKLFLADLAHLSNEQLEKLLNEHLDLCHYRFDAWLLGLANYRLQQLRQKQSTGIYLGAYGYLENVRPRLDRPGVCLKVVDPPQLVAQPAASIIPVFDFEDFIPSGFTQDQLLSQAFVYLGSSNPFDLIGYDEEAKEILPLPYTDQKNQGFIPTPSLGHAVTAAVLHSAHHAHQEEGSALDSFAINLSSSRVREAMYLLEGLENGQDIGALLGYKFERLLRENDLELSQYIYEFRIEYPFRVQDIDQPVSNDGDDSDQRIVTDGKRLVKAYRDGIELQNFLNTLLAAEPEPGKTEKESYIKQSIEKLDTSLDAINDLLLSESFYQIAVGNPDRSRAALKMINDGGNIQLPQIVDIPRTGISLTHKVGIMLPTRGLPTEWGGPLRPRAVLDTRINRYLRTKLPEQSKIVIRVRWQAGELEDGQPIYQFENVPISKLLIQPVDLVYMYYQQRNSQNESELRYRINAFVRKLHDLADDQFVEILEQDRTGFASSEVHLYALDPLLLGLAEMILGARHLSPEDLQPPAEQTNGTVVSTQLDWRSLNGRLHTVYQMAQGEYDQLLSRTEGLTSINQLSQEEIDTDQLDINRKLTKIRENLLFFTELGIGNALPPLDYRADKVLIERIYLQAKSAQKTIQKRLAKLLSLGIMTKDDLKQPDGSFRKLKLQDLNDYLIQPLKDDLTGTRFAELSADEIFNELKEGVAILMGRSYQAFPSFRIPDKEKVQKAYEHRENLLADAGDFPVEEWLQSIVPIRPNMHAYFKLNMLTEMFNTSGSDRLFEPIQLPYNEGGEDRWLGMEYNPSLEEIDTETNERKINEDTLSLVFEYSDDFDIDMPYSGFIIDEWNEIIPLKDVNTGVAMHYDQANNEAPNTILIAVPAAPTGAWNIEELFSTIDGTMQLARKRAVDPDLLKSSFLSQFLPAVLAAINPQGSTPSLDYGRVIAQVQPGANGFALNRYNISSEIVTSMDIDDLEVADVFDEDDL